MTDQDTTTEAPARPPMDPRKQRLREAVRFFYDLQKLRIQSGNRNATDEVDLSERDAAFMSSTGDALSQLEKKALGQVKQLLRGVPVYERWLSEQKGCGVTLSGLIVSEIDIARCDNPSKLWRYCGLAVDPSTGRAERAKKGEKLHYSPWLKAKLVHVLGECLIKASSPWRVHYDNYKHRKENQQVPQCMLCEGTGKSRPEPKPGRAKRGPGADVAAEATQPPAAASRTASCANCGGTGGPAPWGRSKAHRHAAAVRFMVKSFLLELWRNWRELEGLPVLAPYSEAVLGRVHGDHGGAGSQLSAE